MDPILNQKTTCTLLDENHAHLKYSLAKIIIVGTNTCDKEYFSPMMDLFNEHRLEQEHAQDTTSFIEILIDDPYKCDYEFFNYMTNSCIVPCLDPMTERQSNNEC